MFGAKAENGAARAEGELSVDGVEVAVDVVAAAADAFARKGDADGEVFITRAKIELAHGVAEFIGAHGDRAGGFAAETGLF